MNNKNFLGKLSEVFINRYRVSYLMIVFIAVTGVMAYHMLPRESAPSITIPSAVISTTYPGASPTDVEKLITDKIEEKVFNMEDVKEVNSDSFLGRSQVQIVFSEDIDFNEKKNLLREKISEITFPEDATKPSIAFDSSFDSPILTLSVSGDYDAYGLVQYAEALKKEISRIKGVGKIDISGGIEREIQVNVNLIKLQNYGITVDEVKQALQDVNINAPIGSQGLNDAYYNLRIDEQFKSVDEIRKVLLKNSAGEFIFLDEIAEIVDTSSRPDSYAGLYKPGVREIPTTLQSVNVDIYRAYGADIVGTTNAVKKVISDEAGRSYPDDVRAELSFDRSVSVKQDLQDVIDNVISGLNVVIIVLFIFIGFSESLIVAFVIPLVMLSTMAVMKYMGITLNSLSILGLIVSLGLVVDNAIVIMENVDRMRHMGLKKRIAAIVGTNQVALSVFAATLTTVAAFFPLTILSGTMGQFLKAIPQVVVIAVIISLVVSLLITPVLCARHLPDKKKKWKYHDHPAMTYLPILLIMALSLHAFRVEGRITLMTVIATLLFGGAMAIKQLKFRDTHLEHSSLIKWYEKAISSLLKSKAKMVSFIISGVLVLALAIAMLPLGLLKVGTFPDSDPTALNISLRAPEGTTLDEMRELTSEVEAKLYPKKEIKNFSVTVGGNDQHVAAISATLVKKEERSKSGLDMLEEVRKDVKDISGISIQVKGAGGGMGGGYSPDTYAIEINVLGDNLEDVKDVAERYKEILSSVEGIETTKLSSGKGIPQLQFKINNSKAKALGVSASEVANELRTYISGSTLTTVRLDNKEVDVNIRLSSDQLKTIEDLRRLVITTTDGSKLPVTAVATIEEVSGVAQISHVDTARIIKIQSNVLTGFNTNEIVNTFKEKVADEPLPAGIIVQYDGEAYDMGVNFMEMANSMWIAVFLVFTILAVQFNSFKQPLVIVAAVPMALIGVIFGLMLTGNEFGLYAFMGLVSLVGIAVNDAIVLVDYINYLRKEGKAIEVAIVEAGKTRFIPVFTTTLTTCGGILPLALKNPYYAQLGYSLIFGLMVATILTLVFIPILYVLLEGKKNRVEEEVQGDLALEYMEV